MDRRLRIVLLALPVVLLHGLAYWASAPRSEGRLQWPGELLAQQSGAERLLPAARHPWREHSPAL